jgi:ribonuclease HI
MVSLLNISGMENTLDNKMKVAYIRYEDSKMHILSPYNEEFISLLKSNTKTRKWNLETKKWVVDVSEREEALKILKKYFSVVEDNSFQRKEIRELVATVGDICINNTFKYNPNILTDAWIDGSCLPINPGGTAGYGLIVKQKDMIIFQSAGIVGTGDQMSNNVAEFCALIALLDWYKDNTISGKIIVHSDSTLLINQITGKWKTSKKSSSKLYYPYFLRAKSKLVNCGEEHFNFEWIPRENNSGADALSTKIVIESK